MTGCPLDRCGGFPLLREDTAEDFAARHAQLSVRGKRVLDCLLILLPSHLKSQPTSGASSFQPALLFSVCDALQPNRADSSAEQDDPHVLLAVLGKLRDWRLLDLNYRYSPAGIHKLALDLSEIMDEASDSARPDLSRESHARLRIKWVGLDSLPRESQDRESSIPIPPSPSSSQSGVFDLPRECAHALPDSSECHSNTRSRSCQAGRLGTPDAEDTGAAVPTRNRSVSGFRSGCSACRHPRLSPPTSTPSSPRMTSISFTDVKQFDACINPDVPSPRYPKSCAQHTAPKKARPEKHKSSRSVSRGAHVDENEPPTSKQMAAQQGIGIWFPRQRTQSPRISNIPLAQEPLSSITASVQQRPQPRHLSDQAPKCDKHTTSRRLASLDLRLASLHPNHASSNDLHPPSQMRAQSFSHTPMKSHGVGSVGIGVPKQSSNAAGPFRSSKRLPSWNKTHPVTAAVTTCESVKPTGSMSPPATRASVVSPQLLPFTPRSRPSSTSIPRSILRDVKHRVRCSVSSRTHKHTLSDVVLPLSPGSPLIHPRRWQV